MKTEYTTERIDTVIIGAGQSGLSTGYHLKRLGVPFVILDAGERVGDVWRARWDSLKLFTPARFSGLDGMPFPSDPFYFPTKDEMGNYLESYARRFALPIRLRTRVDRLSKQGDGFLVVAGDRRYEARNVVVAMASYQRPRVPPFASELDPSIVQIHSFDYRNPSQLRDGGVLIVGAGNSGAEIAVETVRGHKTWVAGRDTGHVPFQIDGLMARLFLMRLIFRVLFHRVLTVDTPIGRKVRPKFLSSGGPLVRTKPANLAAAGIERVRRVVGVRNGLPLLEDGRALEVTNVVWCTGFHPGFSWIDLPVFEATGEPRHERGLVPSQPGLYFVGLNFLYSLSSTMIHGIGRDAERIARAVAGRSSAAATSARDAA